MSRAITTPDGGSVRVDAHPLVIRLEVTDHDCLGDEHRAWLSLDLESARALARSLTAAVRKVGGQAWRGKA